MMDCGSGKHHPVQTNNKNNNLGSAGCGEFG